MKVFLLAPHEDWICDRFVSEWKAHNSDITVDNPQDADIIWLLSDWAWDKVPYKLLQEKIVLTSIHHIVPEKFSPAEQANFRARDAVTDLYHVPCGHTEKQVNDILGQLGLTKMVICRPFWVNDQFWLPTPEPRNLREIYGVGSKESFLVGSFQRDTEGSDLKTPKYEKGPDLLCDMVESLHKTDERVQMVLAGWRRQYVIRRLETAGISYRYIERPRLEVVRDLYRTLNLYVVAARYEGGPQSIVECAALAVPIVSTDVGLAPEILDPQAIFNPQNIESFKAACYFAQAPETLARNRTVVSNYFLEPSFKWYRNLLDNMLNNERFQ